MDVPSASPILSTIVSMQTARSFFDSFKSLSRTRRNAVFPYVKDKLPYLIKNSYDFFLVFVYLDANQQSQMLNNYKGMIPSIKNFSNFYDLLNALIPELRFKLITFFVRKGKASLLSDDLSKVYLIILRFERKDRFLVLTMLNSEGKVSSLFGNLLGFQRFLDYFEPKDYLAVLNELNKEGKINTLLNFKDASSVIMFLKTFPTLNRLEVFKVLLTIKETAILFAKETSFQAVFNVFGSNFHLSMADGLQKNLIINTADKFLMFFKQLKVDDSIEFVSMISSSLPSIITNIDKFEFVFKELDAKQRALLFPYIKEHLCSLVNDGRDFMRVNHCLTPHQVSLFKNSFFSSDVVRSPARPRLC